MCALAVPSPSTSHRLSLQEEVDWYVNVAGPYHTKCAMDSAVEVTEDEDVQRWITCCNDMVVVNAVSVVVGTSALQKLVAHFIARKE